jgi:hypothetical protein
MNIRSVYIFFPHLSDITIFKSSTGPSNTFCQWLTCGFIAFARLSRDIKESWNFPREVRIIYKWTQVLIKNLWIIVVIYHLSNILLIIFFKILSPKRPRKPSIMSITNFSLLRINKLLINKFLFIDWHKIYRIKLVSLKQWLGISLIHPILQANLPSWSILAGNLSHRATALIIWPPAGLLFIIGIQTRLAILRTLFDKLAA